MRGEPAEAKKEDAPWGNVLPCGERPEMTDPLYLSFCAKFFPTKSQFKIFQKDSTYLARAFR